MAVECKNCKANPARDGDVTLHRINPFGITGEWICQGCLDETETLYQEPHYVHSKTCPSYCDYACNGQFGFDLAEQIKKYLNLKPANAKVDASGGSESTKLQ